MFTYYCLSMITESLMGVAGTYGIPLKYQIGLSSTCPTRSGTNITEPDKNTGYQRVIIDNDGRYFTSDNASNNSEFVNQNTHLLHTQDKITISITNHNHRLSAITIYGNTIKTDNNFKHLNNIVITIDSMQTNHQILKFGEIVSLKSFGKSSDKLVCIKDNCFIDSNVEEIIINGYDYKLHATQVDTSKDGFYCKIFREHDDTYLSTKETFDINKNNQFKVSDIDNLMLIKITFQELIDAGMKNVDFDTITKEELNDYLARYLKLSPIKLIYELPQHKIIYLDSTIQNQFKLLALNFGDNNIKITSSLNTVNFDIEYKKIRPFVFNTEPLVFNESISAWDNLKYITLFDENDNLLYYSELSEAINVPARCILSIPSETLKIEAVNISDSNNNDYYTREEIDNKVYMTEPEVKSYIHKVLQPTKEILQQIVRGE